MQLDGVMATRKVAVVPFAHYLMSGSYYRAWLRRCWHTVIYYRFPMIMAWFNLSLVLGMVCVCVFVAFAYRKSGRGSSCKRFMKIQSLASRTLSFYDGMNDYESLLTLVLL